MIELYATVEEFWTDHTKLLFCSLLSTFSPSDNDVHGRSSQISQDGEVSTQLV